MYGHFCYCVAICGAMWPFWALYGFLWHYVAIDDIMRHCVAICCTVWPFVVLCGTT